MLRQKNLFASVALGAALVAGSAALADSAHDSKLVAQTKRARSKAEPDYAAVLKEAHAKFKDVRDGKNADYIPALDKVNSNYFGIVIVTVDGDVYTVGDADVPFAIESVSKPFTLAMVMDKLGPDAIEEKIGVNQTGKPFNAADVVEDAKTHPAGNPLVNAGAITTVSLVDGKSKDDTWNKIIGNLNAFAGTSLKVNQEVYKSESETNDHNKALTYLLTNDKVITSNPEQALDLYTKQCSVNVTAKDLAVMGATLAAAGKNPITKRQVVKPETASHVLAVMATTGLYETTGQWLYKVGLPAKSGVGGGIVAVVPGKYAIATFSPPLDEAGNSVRGQKAIEFVVDKIGGNLFEPSSPTM